MLRTDYSLHVMGLVGTPYSARAGADSDMSFVWSEVLYSRCFLAVWFRIMVIFETRLVNHGDKATGGFVLVTSFAKLLPYLSQSDVGPSSCRITSGQFESNRHDIT